MILLLGFIALLLIKFFLVRQLFKLSSKERTNNKIKRKPIKSNLRSAEKNTNIQNEQFSCAFFHPNCSAGGGGERTLFSAIISIKSRFKNVKLALFLKSDVKNQITLSEIKAKALNDFNLSIPDDIELIPLKSVFLAESKTWPRLTLLGQIIGSIILSIESIIKFRPDILIDTAGFPFIYPIMKIIKCRLVAYVHYPFISNDMIQKIQMKSYNNSERIANNNILRNIKIFYYRCLSNIYSFCGKYCDLAFTNSSWTNGHIMRSWNGCPLIKILYPPCDLTPFTNRIILTRKNDSGLKIISLSQFRPEKNHKLQLEIAAQVLETLPEAKFIFIGGCRNSEDEERVQKLKSYAERLGIHNSVQFKLNIPFDELLDNLQEATIGLHTMTEEHFGIGIVELMAAGLITVAHNSGGPRADIIKKDIGFLCNSVNEYSNTIIKIAQMSNEDRIKISQKARENVINRFSEEIFSKGFANGIETLMIK